MHAKQQQPQAIVERHVAAVLKQDMAAVLANFATDAHIVTADGVRRGHDGVRSDMAEFFAELPADFAERFEIVTLRQIGEIVFLIWHAPPYFTRAVETFLIRDGKIEVQTYAAC